MTGIPFRRPKWPSAGRTAAGLLSAVLLAGASLAAGCAPASLSGSTASSTSGGLETVSEGTAARCQPPGVPSPASGRAAFLWTPRGVVNQKGVVTTARPAARTSIPDPAVRILTWQWDSARWHIVRAAAAMITVPGQRICNGGPAGFSNAPGFSLAVYASALPGETLQWVRVIFARGPETASALHALVASKVLSNSYMTCTSHSCTGGLHMAYGYGGAGVRYCAAPRPSGAALWNVRTGGSGVLAVHPVLLSRHDWDGDIWHAYETVGWPLPPGAVLRGGHYAVWEGPIGPPDCIVGAFHLEQAYGRQYAAVNVPRGVTSSGDPAPGDPPALQWAYAYLVST